MPGIEELHFEVILDKDKFQRDVEAIQRVAENLNNTLTQSLNLTKSVGSGISGMVAPQTQYTQAVEKTNTALTGTGNLMRTISQLTGVAFGVVGLRRFTTELIQTAGAFEVQKAALSSMLQDAEKAGEIFSTLRQKALESPYTFQDLTKFAKQLIAFNIPADQLVETERRLADVAAGLGVDMGRIILAYGQVKAAGALKGQELRQFTEAGVPILEQLAKQIEEVEHRTVSLSEVFNRVTKKQIPFEMVEEAFRRMTDEGGKFYNMQAVLVETLQGKISKLRDVWQQVLYDLGMENEGILKGAVDLVTELVQHLDELGKRIPQLIAMWGAYKVAQVAAEVATGNFALANHGLLSTLTKIGAWIAKNPYAILAAAVAGVTIEAIRFGKQMYEDIHKEEIAQKQLNAALKEASTNITAERTALKQLAMVAGDELRTMNERQRAIDAINAQYGEYIKNLGLEKVSVDNLGTAYEKLTTAIGQKYLAELKEQTVGSRTSALADARTALVNFNSSFLKTRPITWKGRTGIAGPGGVGQILGEIEAMLINHPLFDEEAATNKIANIYNRYGIRIKAGSDEAGDLYRVASDYVMAARLLRQSEGDFKNFADAYGLAIGGDKKTTTEPQKGWGEDWNPVGGNKDKLKVPFIDIDKAMEEVDRELLAILAEDTKKLDAQLDKRFNAMNEWDSFMEKWKYTRGVREGEGASFKLSGYISDFNRENFENLFQYKKLLKDLGDQFGENSAAYVQGKKDLDDWKKAVDSSARNRLKERVRGLADDLIKEGLVGFDLTNWSDKNLTQINEIRDALKKVELPESFRKQLKDDEELLTLIIKELNRLKNEKIDNTVDPERWKLIEKRMRYIAKSFVRVAESLKELGDATGNKQLATSAEMVGRIAQNVQAAEEGAKAWGGWWGAIIGGVVDMFTQVVDGVTESEKAAQELKQTITEIALELEKIRFNDALSAGVDSIFGENSLKRVHNAVEELDKLAEKAGEIKESLVLTVPRPYNRESYMTIRQIADELGFENIYNKDGFLDPIVLEKIINTYGDANKEILESLKLGKEAIEQYKKAMDAVDEELKNLVGDIASSAADKIVNSWIEAGDAALDYADILDDVARSYAQMLIQSSIIEDFLDPITADLKSAFMEGRYEDAMTMIAGAMDGIAEAAPMFENILSAFDPYFQSSSDTNSVGGGIKSITEETASLLASYINAMRADLSYMRGLQEKGWATVDAIGGAIPTLNDYLNQIAGNTADSARDTAAILSRLEDVIGASGSDGLVVRVSQA